MEACRWYFSSRGSQQSVGETTNANQGLVGVPDDHIQKYSKMYKPGQCPLCKTEKIDSPCVLICSGFVFCTVCITEHLEGSKKCPITGFKCGTENIRKIYVE